MKSRRNKANAKLYSLINLMLIRAPFSENSSVGAQRGRSRRTPRMPRLGVVLPVQKAITTPDSCSSEGVDEGFDASTAAVTAKE
jgi:hypothetical protein